MEGQVPYGVRTNQVRRVQYLVQELGAEWDRNVRHPLAGHLALLAGWPSVD